MPCARQVRRACHSSYRSSFQCWRAIRQRRIEERIDIPCKIRFYLCLKKRIVGFYAAVKGKKQLYWLTIVLHRLYLETDCRIEMIVIMINMAHDVLRFPSCNIRPRYTLIPWSAVQHSTTTETRQPPGSPVVATHGVEIMGLLRRRDKALRRNRGRGSTVERKRVSGGGRRQQCHEKRDSCHGKYDHRVTAAYRGGLGSVNCIVDKKTLKMNPVTAATRAGHTWPGPG